MSTETGYDPELMAAVTELGDALRGLVDASVRTTVPPADLQDVAATARELATRLRAQTRERHQLPVLDDPVAFRRVFSPVTGVGSAVAPPLRIRADDQGPGVVAEASFGLQYEGPPGFLHGGMSGLLMDQMLGTAAIRAGRWGMTAHLALDYRGPVPLDTPVVLRAWVAEEHGRRTTMAGSIALAADPDRILVEVSGVFVTPREDKLAAYFGDVTDASGQHRPPGRATDATALHEDR
ncbi:Thioesterase superfamily protein [Klenkia soli]|uniref:Thioesterase superfamily protein n=1 Tax=Klenkia soli TaxID=1052260 RepID=A0A1H0UA43_9ACTN|nr:PaaI family thioesterase [Klenkia soli]SDP63172.1 Thioesterase superfamily protein [Klenkia soli]